MNTSMVRGEESLLKDVATSGAVMLLLLSIDTRASGRRQGLVSLKFSGVHFSTYKDDTRIVRSTRLGAS